MRTKGLTLLESASLSGLSLSSLVQMEKGNGEPYLRSLFKVARGLVVPLLRLLLACEGERAATVVRPGDRIIVRWPRLNVDLVAVGDRPARQPAGGADPPSCWIAEL